MELGKYIEETVSKLTERIRNLETQLNVLLPGSPQFQRAAEQDQLDNSVRQDSIYLGTVVDNRDKFIAGRCLVRIHGRHRQDLAEDKLEMIEPIQPFGGLDDCGSNWAPPVGSQVVVLYSGGLLGQGYYLGTVPRSEVLDKDGKPVAGQRGVRLFDRRWSGYEYRQTGHLGTLKNEDLPPWASESYRNTQRGALSDQDTSEPSIFGFKTPEKHFLKLCDGFFDQKLMGKRVVLQSSKGNLLYMKDDMLNKPEAYEKGSPLAPKEGTGEDRDLTKGFFENGTQVESANLRGNLYETYPVLKKDGDPWARIEHTPNDHVIVSGTILSNGTFSEGGGSGGGGSGGGGSALLNSGSSSIGVVGAGGSGSGSGSGSSGGSYECKNILEMTGAVLQSAMGNRLIMDDNFAATNLVDSDNTYLNFRSIKETEKLSSFIKLESISEHSIVLSDQESAGGVRGTFSGIFLESALGNCVVL